MSRPVKKRENRKSKRIGNQIIMHASDFCQNSPETIAKSRANLRQNKGKRKPSDPNTPARPKRPDLKGCDIIQFATEYLGVSFEERPAQEVVLRAQYGLPMSDSQLDLYAKLTHGRMDYEPGQELKEGVWCLGRRSGKSLLVAIIALYESICKAHIHRKHVGKNQIAYAILIATKLQQCIEVVQAFCLQLLVDSSLSYLIDTDNQDSLLLTNKMCIQSFPCSSSSIRGYGTYLLIYDELAFFYTEGKRADKIVCDAARPGTIQFPESKILEISSPAAKQGVFFEHFDQGFNVTGRLTTQAESRTMNPVLPQSEIDAEYRRDPEYAQREYGAQFAETTEGFFMSCVDKLRACFQYPDEEDMPYQSRHRYYASIDQSGLSGRDLFAFSIAHSDSMSHKITVDVVREWATKDIDVIKENIKALCSAYRIIKIRKDRYAGGIIKSILEKIGLGVEDRDLLPVIYTNFKTLVLSEKLILPDKPSLRNGLIRTQAFYGKSQSLSIQHERTSEGHGDLADSVVDAAYQASQDYSLSDLQTTTFTTTQEEDAKSFDYDMWGRSEKRYSRAESRSYDYDMYG